MSPDIYRRAGDLFHHLRELPESDRLTALEAACAGDAELRAQVLRLIEADQRAAEGFLENRAIEDAARLLSTQMPLLPEAGTILANYRLGTQIGVGGMGVVYEAQDLRLDRRVAFKILPPGLAAESKERIQRFRREARAASGLNHPNIVSIFEADFDQGYYFIAMEFVDGKTLRQLVASTAPLDNKIILDVISQIASALSAAHAAGIVHRDIKPENIMVRADGFVKVLDFGLATLRERESNAAGGTDLRTRPGNLAGTIQYLSPEQVLGNPVGPTSDLFSLGVVAYELSTGVRPFDGPTDGAVIDAILNRAPPAPSTIRPALIELDALIMRAIEKDPELRFQTGHDLRSASRLLVRGSQVSTPSGVRAPSPGHARRAWRQLALAATVAAAVTAGLGIIVWAKFFGHPQATAPQFNLEMVVPASDDRSSFALSPDGRRIAFAASGDGSRRLWVRALDSTSAQPLPATEGASSPFWSPDSNSLGFFADLKLKRIDLGGAQPEVLASVPSVTAQGTWGAAQVILFSWGVTPLSRVPASGGQVTVATNSPKDQLNQFTPRFLPNGKQFLFVVNGVDPGIWLGSLDGAAPRRIASIAVGADSAAEYVAPGYLVRVRQGVLEAQRFDADRAQLSGEAIPLERSVGVDASNLAGLFSASASGTIAWRRAGMGQRQLTWFNRSGQNLGTFGAPGDSTLYAPELSPDSKRVATMRGPVGSSDIWLQDVIRNIRFTFDPADDRYPLWSPDGKRVAFASNRAGAYDLYEKSADGSGTEQILLKSPELKRPNSWSPDGRFILYWSAQNNGDLMVLPLTGDRKPFVFLSTAFNEQQGVFSPDGRWIAYQSDESGRFEIYARPFPGPGAPLQISAGGGQSPRWRTDGKELYYLAPDLNLMAAKFDVQGTRFTAVEPKSLFQTQINQATNKQQYAVARDGRFLILTELRETSAEPIHLLLNWQPR